MNKSLLGFYPILYVLVRMIEHEYCVTYINDSSFNNRLVIPRWLVYLWVLTETTIDISMTNIVHKGITHPIDNR